MFEPHKSPQPKPFTAAALSGKNRPRWLVPAAVIVLVAAAGVGGWAIWGGDTTGDTQLTQKVAIGTIEDTVTALGNIQPLQFVDVGTQVSGQLRELHVDYGASVKKGDLLAEIDPTIYQARVSANEAQLMNLRAQLAQRIAQRKLAELQFGRQKELLQENATSQEAYDSAEANLKVAAAQIDQLEAQIKQTESTLRGDQANLGYTKIYSPMDGVVVNLIAKKGQTLNANQTAPLVLRVADLDTMTVWAQVSEADVPKLEIGMEAYFTTLGTSDRRRYGKLRKIIPTPDVVNNVVLYNCLFDVENPDRDLLTQMSAQVYFVVASARNVPVVPIAALHPIARQRGERAQPSGDAPQAADGSAPRDGQQGRANRFTDGQPADQPQTQAQPAPVAASPAGSQGRGERRRQQRGSQVEPTRYNVHVVKNGNIETREVEIGVMNRLSAEVKSGLAVDEEVVLDGGLTPQGQRRAGPGNQTRPGGGFGGGPRL